MGWQVRWNATNGKLTGLGLLFTSAMIGYTVFNSNGKNIEGPGKVLLEHAALMALAGLHVMFNANPTVVVADKSKKTK